VILRWPVVEPKLKHLLKFNIHPLYTYLFKKMFINSSIDFKSEWLAGDSGDPNNTFSQLISENECCRKKYQETW